MPRMKRRQGAECDWYYFVHDDGYQEPLGSDFDAALEKWKQLYHPGAGDSKTGFTKLSNLWKKSKDFGLLAPKTQREYGYALNKLQDVFKSTSTENIGHPHILKMKREMRETPVLFKRYKACLSSFWNWTQDEEHLDAPNPCIGIKGYKSAVRQKIKVTDTMYFAVYDEAEPVVRDWMNLDVVCGPRVVDCFMLKKTDIEHGKLFVAHGKKKTGTILPVEADLKEVIDELLRRDRKVSSIYLIADEDGQPLTYGRLQDKFDAAKERAKEKALADGRPWVDWQRRDLRSRNASDADTLQEAQERLGHDDSKTTARHYRQSMKARPGRLPKRA